ncbi:autotransporter assembly complex family protein [Cognatishimia sp. MH4019]|uniref:autotransporter assembly complex protein TamA n=1 Tax=Cognatishimia sp. MH4019 TaxID=2854030 RepID=UPI001CD60E6F|nr:autotransporter assembly complex family protein [Cognatishimia sp. MH4019]
MLLRFLGTSLLLFRIYLVHLVFACVLASGAAALDVDLRTPGIDDDLAEKLRNASLLVQTAQEEDPAAPIEVLANAQADYARLVTVLYEAGRFGPAITISLDGREAASIPPIAAPARINRAVITVTPGPVFALGQTRISPLARRTELPESFASGQTASVSALQDGVAAAIEGWRQIGHAKAAVDQQQITARHSDRALDVDVRLDPGPRLRFGRLDISSESAVRPDRIREIAGLPTGDVFDPDAVAKSQTRLRRTGTFRVAALTEAETANPDGTLDIEAQITDQPPRRLSFGAEISSLDGLGVSASWLHRNFFGGAERFVAEAEVGGIGAGEEGPDYRLFARLSRPATYLPDLEAYALVRLEQIDDPNLFSRRFALEGGATYFAGESREFSVGIGYQAAEIEDDLGERDYTILTFPAVGTFDERNDRLNATAGFYGQLALTPFVGLSGTESGLRTSLDLRTYRSFGVDDRVTFAVRGQLGSVAGPDIEEAPADFLFFSGGGGTVRGHEYQSLGVDLEDDVTIGGRSFLGLSTELRVKTGDNLSVVGFYDMGYIGAEEFPDGTSGEWHAGAGAGVRYDTGIGPIRLDLAVPVSGPDDTDGFEIYIGIGQAF